ncbi:MAG: hypothetical protein IJC26_06690 [Clostridia bacterium]|nr:hypothetical protein [Clostridia bacterium]
MKFYEAPDFTKVEFFTEDILDNSIIDPTEGINGSEVELGKIPLFN